MCSTIIEKKSSKFCPDEERNNLKKLATIIKLINYGDEGDYFLVVKNRSAKMTILNNIDYIKYKGHSVLYSVYTN